MWGLFRESPEPLKEAILPCHRRHRQILPHLIRLHPGDRLSRPGFSSMPLSSLRFLQVIPFSSYFPHLLYGYSLMIQSSPTTFHSKFRFSSAYSSASFLESKSKGYPSSSSTRLKSSYERRQFRMQNIAIQSPPFLSGFL